MYSRVHQKLGTAGLIVAIVALVAALGGGAYAAGGGLTAKEKKQVKKIAQTEVKKIAGVPGAPGAVGPVGPPGPAGANGKDGKDGTNGKNVTTGNEPTGTSNCEEQGGVWVEVEGSGLKRYVCNGKDGEEGTSGSGGTMTGQWSFSAKGLVSTLMSISYPERLPADPTYNWIGPGGSSTTACPGSAANPEAAPGNVCLYAASMNAAGEGTDSHPVENYTAYTPDPQSGLTVEITLASADSEGYGWGSWAATPAVTP
jgi:hypothetical protein